MHPEKPSGGSPAAAAVRVWTMRIASLDELAVTPWLAMLDASERERAARFVRPKNRVEFVAAHALLRAALGELAGLPPAALRFVAGAHGKPFLFLPAAPAALSFNLSHTAGAVGLAAIARAQCALGFDLEPLGRKVDLAVADRFFSPPEVTWLRSLPPAAQPAGFLRLWTLKEAFIKATGKGLTQNLASFSFDPDAPAIRFAPDLAEHAGDWWFEQRVLDDGFVAAVGLRREPGETIEARWALVDPEEIGTNGFKPRSLRG